jgi:general stress protein 26
MTHYEDIKKQIRELLINQKLAVLSTHHSGQPYASLIAFVGKEDLKEIFFVTPRTTRKFVNLSADSRVAILINSSLNMDSDFHEVVSITALGNTKEINGSEKDEILIWIINILKVKVKAKVQKLFRLLKQEMIV